MQDSNSVTVSRILVPTDFSSHAELALKWAQRLAQPFAAKLILLHVLDIYSVAQTSCRMVGSDFLGMLRDEASHSLEKLRAVVPEAEALIVEGSPRPAIVETALELDCQMIVMGTHGRSGLAHILLGSVAEYVIRHSKVPVLTVHAESNSNASGVA